MLAKPSVLAKSSMAVTLDGNIPGWMSSLQWIHKSQVWPSNRAECMTTNVLMFLQWLVSTNVSLRTRASRMTQPSHPSQVLVAVLQSLKLSVHSAQSCRVKVPQGSGIGSWRCTLSLPIYICVCVPISISSPSPPASGPQKPHPLSCFPIWQSGCPLDFVRSCKILCACIDLNSSEFYVWTWLRPTDSQLSCHSSQSQHPLPACPIEMKIFVSLASCKIPAAG